MKILTAIFFCCLFDNIAIAQNDVKSKAFISEVIAERNKQDSINLELFNTGNKDKLTYKKSESIYMDSVGGYYVNMMLTGMKTARNNIFYSPMDYGMDPLVLTNQEWAYINGQISMMKSHAWEKDLVPGFSFVPVATTKKLNDAKIKDDQNSSSGKRTYTFGVPLFLRNNTYCFFYYGYWCGELCGGGNFSIYKKVNGKWQLWSILNRWIS